MDDVTVAPMTGEFLLWRCLHGGPLTLQNIEHPIPDARVPWNELRARNLPLLQKLVETYGTCAILARAGERIIGQLRFYPKEVCAMQAAGELCLQQVYPAGPEAGFARFTFPPLEQLKDRTLRVHCMMTGSPSQAENPYQRKGIAARMVQCLVDWSRRQGWKAIEAVAYEDLGIVYAITGSTGKSFWQKLGFRISEVGVEPAIGEDEGFARVMQEQAAANGLPLEAYKNRYLLRLELGLNILLLALPYVILWV
jgi:GNAT superfamily N-acetyltransferase